MKGSARVTEQTTIEAPTSQTVLERQFARNSKGDTTPSVENAKKLIFKNVAPITVTKFDNGQPNQDVAMLGDGFTTIANNANIKTSTGADLLLETDKVYDFTYFEGKWVQDADGSAAPSGGELLARYVASGGSPLLLSPDTVLEQIIPGVTITINLTAAKLVGIFMRLEFTSLGGASRFLIKENGVKVWPEYGTQANWIQSSGDGALFFLAEALCIRNLVAGSYTYTVWEAASGSLAGKTYYNRIIEARDYT